MRLCSIVAIFSLVAFQVECACQEELLKLFTHDVADAELKMNITMDDLLRQINVTSDNVDAIIRSTKSEIQSERDVLADSEARAYGKAMVEKKSIADCLEDDRIQMRLINTTESVIYSVCRADFSLFLVKLFLGAVKSASENFEKSLNVCINDFANDCEKEKSCIIEALQVADNELVEINSNVQKKLKKITETSEICADGKKSVVISMIKEQENKFTYCVNQILNINRLYDKIY